MNKLSKEKREKLILVCIGIVAVLGLLYTFVLGAQKDKISAVTTQISGTRTKLEKAEASMQSAPVIEATLAESKKAVEGKQEHMAPQGQYYYWFLKLVDQFRKDEKLDSGFIMDITQPEFVDAGLLPKMPYKAASFGLRVNGSYHEIGRFIADLENNFSYFRVENVRLSPQAATTPGATTLNAPLTVGTNDGKLVAELRIVTLIKPGTI